MYRGILLFLQTEFLSIAVHAVINITTLAAEYTAMEKRMKPNFERKRELLAGGSKKWHVPRL